MRGFESHLLRHKLTNNQRFELRIVFFNLYSLNKEVSYKKAYISSRNEFLPPRMATAGYACWSILKFQERVELTELVEVLERLHRVWMEPCVEDVMRLAVNHANVSGSDKQWWDFTAERIAYRE